MKALVAVLAIVWAAANLIVAYLFITDAFVAKTAAKEGPPAQAALLLGGLLIAVFAVLVARQGLALLRGTGRAS